MVKSRQFAKIILHGSEYRIIMDNAKRNQYKIVRRWFDRTPDPDTLYDRPKGWRTQTVARYADYTSCLYWIAQEANLYNKGHEYGMIERG